MTRRWSSWALVATVLLGACGGGGSSAAAPRSACKLFTPSDASNAMRQRIYVAPLTPQGHVTGQQSVCVWQGTVNRVQGFPPLLDLTVSWSPKMVSSFSIAHSGKARVVSVNSPPGVATPVLSYTPLQVDGTTAYWATQQVTPARGPQEILTASKEGYVLTLGANELTQAVVERVMQQILGRLSAG